MSRRIITSQLQATGNEDVDGYFDRLVKYIPSDVVGLWLVGMGLINTFSETSRHIVMLLFFVVCLGITIWWTHDQTAQPGKTTAKTQIAVAALAFVIWVIALQGMDIHAAFNWYRPAFGSLLLLVYTTIVARKVPKEG